jgi:uncharacterized membrane protein YphA (DoxX/SURF4 family)
MNTYIHSAPIFLIRLLVGWVFFIEGILKFLWWNDLGTGRFATIGIPVPGITAPFVGIVEIVCGALILAGFFTRLAAIPLLIEISVAILSTKVPIWLGHPYWRFSLPQLKHYGLLSMLHEARTDFSMFLGLVFLIFVGSGTLSLDAYRASMTNKNMATGDQQLPS